MILRILTDYTRFCTSSSGHSSYTLAFANPGLIVFPLGYFNKVRKQMGR